MNSPLGIVILDSQFPRIPGDMGHPESWPFPVRWAVVDGASPERVVCKTDTGLLAPFIDAARGLIAEGAIGITTTCGFLALFQDELSAALDAPVASSALMQVAMVNATLPPSKRAGIVTISAANLTQAHLSAARVPPGTPIGQTAPNSHFTKVILGDQPEMDVAQARADNVAAAKALQAAYPELGALVLECTNMTPYAPDIQAATELPVYTIMSFANWFRSGLVPPHYPAP